MAIKNAFSIKKWRTPIIVMFMPVLWLLSFFKIACSNLTLDEQCSVHTLQTIATSLGTKDGLILFSITALSFAVNYYWCKCNRPHSKMIWDYTKFMSTILIMCSMCIGLIVYAMESA